MVERGHISVKGVDTDASKENNPINISVKYVDMDTFLEIRSIAARNRRKMGDIVTQALKMWLKDYREHEMRVRARAH